jgi:hypothetical protein
MCQPGGAQAGAFLAQHRFSRGVFEITGIQAYFAVLLFELMRLIRSYNSILFLIVGLLAAAFGCEPQIIYVTPTPDPTSMAQQTAAAQVVVLPTDTLTETPTSIPTETATDTPLPPTETPFPPTATGTPIPPPPTDTLPPVTAPIPPITPGPTSPAQGPIVGPDYSLPATAVPPTPIGIPPTEGASPTPLPPDFTPVPINLPNLDMAQMGIQLDVNLDDDDWNAAMDSMVRLGIDDETHIRWVKVQIPWREMQPDCTENTGLAFFRRVEQHLEDANRRGFQVLVSIVKAPGCFRSNHAEDGPPDDPQALADFITFMFREINAGSRPEDVAVYGNYIDAVEIWNEPNLNREWQGTLAFSGQGYMDLFDAGYRAVRAVSPDIPVITAGLAPTSGQGARNDREFLREMYAAGLASYNDPNLYIGIHPYGWGNAPDATCCNQLDGRSWDDDPSFFFSDTVRQYREIMVNSGDSGRRMWVTEFGWASWDGLPGGPPDGDGWISYNNRWAQGGYTIRAFQIGQETDYIGPMILWNLNFAVLSGLLENRDERAAYSILVPGSACQIDIESDSITERPLYWMIYDAVRPATQLPDYCGIPPTPLPGLP